MPQVIFLRKNVSNKRKTIYPCPDFTTVGNKDNTVCLFVENGQRVP